MSILPPIKNIHPRKLAIIVAGVTAIMAFVLIFLCTHSFKISIFISVILCAVSFITNYNLVNVFIQRKIKLIYKLISQTKATKREEFFNNEILPPKSIDEASHEVINWANKQRNELEKLQVNEQFRKEFLMNLAHEIKTPLFAAQSYIQTLLDGALRDNEVNEQFLRKAEKNMTRLSVMIADLDQITKLESNLLSIELKPFMLLPLLREIIADVKLKSLKKNISIFIKKGCEKDYKVVADEIKIKQVLTNLFDNATHYSRENGEIQIGIYEVDKLTLLIEITDNGIGIKEEELNRIFERFYRTETARVINKSGSGIGLAIVKHIIEAHHQTITCRSKVDVGTTFGFTLQRKLD